MQGNPKGLATLTLTNQGTQRVAFSICAAEDSTQPPVQGLPTWLDVWPSDGVLLPQVQLRIPIELA